MRIAITGIGALTPAGVGKEAFWDALTSRRSFIGPMDRFKGYEGAGLKGLAVDSILDDRRFRRASIVTKLALVAAKLALKDAGLRDSPGALEGIQAAVVTGVTHGALAFSCDFHKGYLEEGPIGASPALFSDSVLNASTGSLSLAFSAKGPSHTLIGGSPVGLEALAFGARLIASKKAELCIVASSEALEEITLSSYSRFGLIGRGAGKFLPGEGAAVMILEELESALGRGAEPIAELSGYCFNATGSIEESIKKTATVAVKNSAIDRAGITHLVVGLNSGNGDNEAKALEEVMKDVVAASITGAFGECFGVSSILSAAAAVMAIKNGNMFDSSINEDPAWAWTSSAGRPVENVLVTSTGLNKEAGSMVFKRI